MIKINIKDTEIRVINSNGKDFVCLTDMMKAKDGEFFISDWLRNRNTLEFLSAWERLNNPNFNYGEFAIITSKAGLNNFKISVKDWIIKTNAIGIRATTGRYGGTYAHKDIAFEFGMWISAEFKLLLITEYQKLKEREANSKDQIWDFRRFLTKVNYRVQTDAVKDILIPLKKVSKNRERLIYAEEADLLYLAMYGFTSKTWRDKNPDLVLKGHNMRDYADTHQLIVLNSLETINAELIRNNVDSEDRFDILRRAAIEQLKSIKKSKNIEDSFIQSPNSLSPSTSGNSKNTDSLIKKVIRKKSSK